jgi:signal transduction histidine kinase
VDLLRSLGDMVMMELDLQRRTSLQQALCSLPSSVRVRKALQRLSHELRTPLHCIRGSMELVLGMEGLPPGARECLQVCVRALCMWSECRHAYACAYVNVHVHVYLNGGLGVPAGVCACLVYVERV